MKPHIRRWVVTTFGLALTCAAAWMAGSNRDAAPSKTMTGPQTSQAADARIAQKIVETPRTEQQRAPTTPDTISARD